MWHQILKLDCKIQIHHTRYNLVTQRRHGYLAEASVYTEEATFFLRFWEVLMLIGAPWLWCTWLSESKIRQGGWESQDKLITVEHSAISHLTCATLSPIPHSAEQFLASGSKKILVWQFLSSTREEFPLGNWIFLEISILACLSVPFDDSAHSQ